MGEEMNYGVRCCLHFISIDLDKLNLVVPSIAKASIWLARRDPARRKINFSDGR